MLVLLLLLACGDSESDSADRSFTTTTTFTGTTTSVSCGAIWGSHQQAFDALVDDNRACTLPMDCQVVEGSCEMGLGETTAVNADVSQADFTAILDAYASEATAAGCPTDTRTCDTTASWQAVCEGGFCSLIPGS